LLPQAAWRAETLEQDERRVVALFRKMTRGVGYLVMFDSRLT